ncbi:MAG: hydrolase TatD [Candidatus Pelagibacter sp.]|jgi:TatD DNase family protein|nr:MAG: hydrolase TatD [Candidatus Pelagibacter sp.]
MIDSHCHLDHAPLFDNLNDILNRSKEVGIKKLLTICTTLESFKNIENILTIDDMIYGTFGIHPHETENNDVSKITIIESIKKNPKLIGVGETGLDFYYNHSKKNKQIESFKKHIEAAIEINLPIIVHSRNAEEETFNILNEYKKHKPKILMHCFTGTYKFYRQMEELDSYFSASGIITFNSSKDLQNTLSKIPNNKLLVETDSPFLAPVPMRGKKNEPSFIKYTLKKLADIKNIDVSEMVSLTTKNFNNLFFN